MKANDRLCETISAMAISLLFGALLAIWYVRLTAAYRDFERERDHALAMQRAKGSD